MLYLVRALLVIELVLLTSDDFSCMFVCDWYAGEGSDIGEGSGSGLWTSCEDASPDTCLAEYGCEVDSRCLPDSWSRCSGDVDKTQCESMGCSFVDASFIPGVSFFGGGYLASCWVWRWTDVG